MAHNVINNFSFNYKHVIIDEIALEGLEGICFDLLWRRIEKRLSSPITEKMKGRFWNFIVNCKEINLYQIPVPFERFEILDRFAIVDEETGQLKEPEVYLDGNYEYHPIENEFGSSLHYHTRKSISSEELQSVSYEKIVKEYSDTLIMVASLEERWQALASHMPVTCMSEMTPLHYCILELVGKGRDNGQSTVGKSNLLKILKEPKLLFYNRNHLQKLDLIRVQCVTQKSGTKCVKILILRLMRFHQPVLMSMPKQGKIHELVKYLLNQPDYAERTDIMIKKDMLTHRQCKKLQKTINIFSFDERSVIPDENPSKKSKAKKELKRRFIFLQSPSDDVDTDTEDEEVPLKCKYKIGVSLLRQAFERFLDAGLKGLTQIELAQLLGIEFYSARSICRIFKAKNLVREFMEDKGKQRIARYIAVPETGEINVVYAEEKEKFLKYLGDTPEIENTCDPSTITKEPASDTEDEVPKKRIKLEKDVQDLTATDEATIERNVTEVKVLDGLEHVNSLSLLSARKSPTLRQLKFANGILKVIREKLVITGYHTLSILAAKEINESPMDTKALKIFVQKLVTDKQLKILKMRCPGNHQQYSVLLCAPHIQSTHPLIKDKYKEMSLKAIRNRQKTKTPKIISDTNTRPLSLFTYPRYMKLQKLHEFLMKLVYFDTNKASPKDPSDLPEGFASLVNIIPEFTVDFAIGNISYTATTEISQVEITEDLLPLKLRDAPLEVYRMILLSSSLEKTIRLNLKVLAMLGLIQLVKAPTQTEENTMLSYLFYVNKNAKIIDTTGTWPRENVDKSLLEKRYHFQTFKDVEQYWNDVYNISTKTIVVVDKEERCRRKWAPVVRLPSEVAAEDKAEILGDGTGPCGFDSCFYMELPRLWSTFFCKIKKKHDMAKKQVRIRLPRREKRKTKPKPAQKKKPAAQPIHQVKPGHRLKISRKRESSSAMPKWSKQEDRILMLCKAAITVMSPVSQPGCLRLRNFVARDILSMNDKKKTGSSCHKRSIVLESNTTLTYEKDCIINEMRHRGNLINNYENLLKKLRIRFTGNMSKLMVEARLPMLQLMWIMHQLTQTQTFNSRIPCVATSLEDFHSKFTICQSSANKSYNLYKAQEFEPIIASIKEGIVFSVMLTYKNDLSKDMSKKIFAMLNEHPEQSLRTAIEQLRKCGAVAAKEKLFNNQMHRFNFPDIVQSSYKISANYQRKWISRLNSDFVENMTSLNMEPPQVGVKGSPEINCMLFEMQSGGALDIVSVIIPVISGPTGSIVQEEQLSAVDIFLKFKLKSGTCGWKMKTGDMKKFSELFGDIGFVEPLQLLSRNAKVPSAASQISNTEDSIVSYLRTKEGSGSTFLELQEHTGYDSKTLTNKLTQLESDNVIKRVGYYENIVILIEFSKDWTMHIGDHHVVPTPWLTLDCNIRVDVFIKWAGVIMNKIFEQPGCSLSYLSGACEYLTTRSVQDVCTFLEQCKCVTLNLIKTPKPDLFSDDDISPELGDYTPYESVDDIIVFPVTTSITRFSYLRKVILDTYYEEEGNTNVK